MTRLRLGTLVFLAFFSPCLRDSVVNAASTTQPAIVAHRGASHDAPENTLAAYRLAFEQGADAIEGDFWLTKDGHVVDTHDESFKRCAGVDRRVGEMTLAEIRRLDVGTWKDASFAGERVPTLDEILAIVPPGKAFFVEIKGGPDVVAAIAGIVAAQSRVRPDQLRMIAFDAANVAAAKRAMPGVPAFWLTSFKAAPGETEKRPTLAEVLSTLDACHADGLDANAQPDVLDAAFAAALAAKGYALHVWTVDDPALARAMVAIGAKSVTTNRPSLLRAELFAPAGNP